MPGVDPRTLIDITHGGTLEFMLDFLNRKNTGYPLETVHHSPQWGLQVIPMIDAIRIDLRHRAFTDYPGIAAKRNISGYETPATLLVKCNKQSFCFLKLCFVCFCEQAKIPLEFLQAQRNEYEAAVRYEHLFKLTDIRIIQYQSTDFYDMWRMTGGRDGYTTKIDRNVTLNDTQIEVQILKVDWK